MKEGERGEKKSHTGPLSHFYGNLKTIIIPCHSLSKELCWWGVRHCEKKERWCVAFSPHSWAKKRRNEWMNECEQNYTDQFSDKRIFCSEFVTSGDGELNQWPLKNPQNQALDQFPFNNINFRDYPVSKHAPQQIAGWLGSRPPQFRGWASPHWIKQTRWKRKQEGKVNINSKRSWFTSTR